MTAQYFVLCRYDRATEWIARDTNDQDFETTVKDLLGGQFDKPIAVFAAEDGRWIDESESIAYEVGNRAYANGEKLTWNVFQFVETHASILFARGLEPECHPIMAMHDETISMLTAAE